MIYLVAYDIVDDRRRLDVSALLGVYGARVQLSVFECELTDPSMLASLREALRRLIDVAEDQIRIYPLPANAERACEILGNRRLEEREDFYIV